MRAAGGDRPAHHVAGTAVLEPRHPHLRQLLVRHHHDERGLLVVPLPHLVPGHRRPLEGGVETASGRNALPQTRHETGIEVTGDRVVQRGQTDRLLPRRLGGAHQVLVSTFDVALVVGEYFDDLLGDPEPPALRLLRTARLLGLRRPAPHRPHVHAHRVGYQPHMRRPQLPRPAQPQQLSHRSRPQLVSMPPQAVVHGPQGVAARRHRSRQPRRERTGNRAVITVSASGQSTSAQRRAVHARRGRRDG